LLVRWFSAAVAILLAVACNAAEITSIPLRGPGQGAIIINGDLAFGDQETFLTRIAPFSSGVVMLNSRGGAAYAGFMLADLSPDAS
jgi:hypothetical protein